MRVCRTASVNLRPRSYVSEKGTNLRWQWGVGPHYTTDRKRIESRQLGFHRSELPKTLQDAVAITRRLGLEYLWIDSLCICQDDAEEWARESSRMVNVYANAHVVIAANHADNSSQGCFHNRQPRPVTRIVLFRFSENNFEDSTVQALLLFPGDEESWKQVEFLSEPLSRRAWALQEWVLAKRVLHYNTRQMYFECNEGIVGEDGCRFKDRLCDLGGENEKLSMLEEAEREKWNFVLRAYGARKLTKATDKLPALSGLARLFAQCLGTEYVAGLWSDHLIRRLAWQGLGSGRILSQDYTGPTWSWANYDGITATDRRHHRFRNVAEIKEWYVKVKTDANPYGEVDNAWIRIRAPMMELKPSPTELSEHERRILRAGLQPDPRMCTQYSDDQNGTHIKLTWKRRGVTQMARMGSGNIDAWRVSERTRKRDKGRA